MPNSTKRIKRLQLSLCTWGRSVRSVSSSRLIFFHKAGDSEVSVADQLVSILSSSESKMTLCFFWKTKNNVKQGPTPDEVQRQWHNHHLPIREPRHEKTSALPSSLTSPVGSVASESDASLTEALHPLSQKRWQSCRPDSVLPISEKQETPFFSSGTPPPLHWRNHYRLSSGRH